MAKFSIRRCLFSIFEFLTLQGQSFVTEVNLSIYVFQYKRVLRTESFVFRSFSLINKLILELFANCSSIKRNKPLQDVFIDVVFNYCIRAHELSNSTPV